VESKDYASPPQLVGSPSPRDQRDKVEERSGVPVVSGASHTCDAVSCIAVVKQQSSRAAEERTIVSKVKTKAATVSYPRSRMDGSEPFPEIKRSGIFLVCPRGGDHRHISEGRAHAGLLRRADPLHHTRCAGTHKLRPLSLLPFSRSIHLLTHSFNAHAHAHALRSRFRSRFRSDTRSPPRLTRRPSPRNMQPTSRRCRDSISR
jgi:hypothetical protein